MEKRETVSCGTIVERMPRAGATGNSTRDASYKKRNTGRKKKPAEGAVHKKAKIQNKRKAPQAGNTGSKKKQRRATTPQNSVTVIRNTIERMLRAGVKTNTGRKKKPAEGAVQKKTKIQKKSKAPQANQSRSKSRAKSKYRT